MRRIIAGVTPATGSSNSTMLGRDMTLAAIASSLRCPYDRMPAGASA